MRAPDQPSARSSTARRADAASNDTKLLNAAISTIARGGWDATTIAAITDSVQLSHGAFYARYADKAQFGTELWATTLHSALADALTNLFEALDSDAPTLSAILESFARPQPIVVAAVEVMLASTHDPRLDDPHGDIEELVSDAISNGATRPERRAAKAASAGLAIGLVLASDRPWLGKADLKPELARYASVLVNPGKPQKLPRERAEYLFTSPFRDEDDRVNKLLEAAASEIGEHGYAEATITKICRSAGLTSGFIYNRYPGKFELFLDVINRQLPVAFESIPEFVGRMTQAHGAAVAEAMIWRDVLDPTLKTKRGLSLEANRLATFYPAMRAIQVKQERELLAGTVAASKGLDQKVATAKFHLDMALGLGFYVLPELYPDSWELPFSSITAGLCAED